MTLVVEKLDKKRRLSESKREGPSTATIPSTNKKRQEELSQGGFEGGEGGGGLSVKGRSAIHYHLNPQSLRRLKIAEVLTP